METRTDWQVRSPQPPPSRARRPPAGHDCDRLGPGPPGSRDAGPADPPGQVSFDGSRIQARPQATSTPLLPFAGSVRVAEESGGTDQSVRVSGGRPVKLAMAALKKTPTRLPRPLDAG